MRRATLIWLGSCACMCAVACAYSTTAQAASPKDDALAAMGYSYQQRDYAYEAHAALIQAHPSAPLYTEYWAGWDMMSDGDEAHAEGDLDAAEAARLEGIGQQNTANLYWSWAEAHYDAAASHYTAAGIHWDNWWGEP